MSWPPLPAHVRSDGGTPLDEDEAAERVLARALRWIEANLEWFAPGRWEEFLPRRPFRPGPLLELLGLVRVLDRSGVVPKDAPLPSRALALAEDAASEADFERGLRRGDEFFPYHLNLVALLEVLGRPQPTLRAAGEALLAADTGGHTRPYKPVLTRTELRYFIDRGGFTAPAPLPDIGTLHRQSIAAQHPDVLQLTGSETYAFTHVLFYATDFGHHRHLLGGSEAVAELRETVRVLLGVHLARGSLDLLAELLLCDSALDDGRGSGPLVYEGWNALAGAGLPDGALPSPVHRPEVLAGLAGDKAAAYLFGTCYHTTLAAALAAAVRKRSPAAGARQPVGFPLPCADPEAIRLWALKASGASAAPASARVAWSAHLGPLLALSVQARDPDVLAEVVHAAERLGQGRRPLVRSAAALLAAWQPTHPTLQ
ncbi:DUF6895 family protein [Streptomyces lydicus]|uniref:DUF6895 family protein n=1 Tax=Streptomyces lydicus TaxID=47763 RepID=UPI001010C6C2|nr:hypothetical protein [Streptomyces lydicus]MCZ1011821.1 hypothetical protein [Streptomyces lydicus]